MPAYINKLTKIFSFLVISLLISCGGGGSSPASYSISGTLEGLAVNSKITLLTSSGESLMLSTNGFFSFTSKPAAGTTLNISISSQPLGQTCTVTNGSSLNINNNISDIRVSCVTTPPAVTTLRAFVDEVANGRYTALTVGNIDLLNKRQSVAYLDIFKNLIRNVRNLNFINAYAQTTSTCLNLSGLRKVDASWEAINVLNNGVTPLCALDAFNVANTHFLITLNNQKIEGKFCNILILRKSDGKSYCLLEDAINNYSLSAKRDLKSGQYTYKPVRVSSNGKYVLVDYSTNQESKLLSIDLSDPLTDPKIQVIWGTPKTLSTDNPLGLTTKLIDYAPTNNGDAAVIFSTTTFTNLNTSQMIWAPKQDGAKLGSSLPLGVKWPSDLLNSLSNGCGGYTDSTNIKFFSGNYRALGEICAPSQPDYNQLTFGSVFAPQNPAENGIVYLNGGANAKIIRFDRFSNKFVYGQSNSGAALFNPIEGNIGGLTLGWLRCGKNCGQYGIYGWPYELPIDSSLYESVVFFVAPISFEGGLEKILRVIPTKVKYNTTDIWGGTNIYSIIFSGKKVLISYQGNTLNPLSGVILFDPFNNSIQELQIPRDIIIDRIENSNSILDTFNITGFNSATLQPFTAQINSSGVLVNLQYFSAGSLSSSISIIPLGL